MYDGPQPPMPTHNACFKMAVRDLVFSPRIGGVEWLFEESAGDILAGLWQEVGEDLPPEQRKPPAGLEMHEICVVAGWLVRPIRCPTPTRMAENHFVAVAVRAGKRSWLPWRRSRPLFRLLTLEYTILEDDRPGTVLGEWRPDRHLTYIEGPEPNLPEFLAALEPILTGRMEPQSMYVRGTRPT